LTGSKGKNLKHDNQDIGAMRAKDRENERKGGRALVNETTRKACQKGKTKKKIKGSLGGGGTNLHQKKIVGRANEHHSQGRLAMPKGTRGMG